MKPVKGQQKLPPRVELLFEIGCEEIPAGMLPRAEEQLKSELEKLLAAESLAAGVSVESFSTPRRLALWARGLVVRQADVVSEITGPPKSVVDEATRQATGEDGSPEYLRACLDASLARLGTDYIDLYQLHLGGLPVDEALDLIPALEDLVSAGKIRAYGWSTDDPARAAAFAKAGPHCAAVQFDESVLNDNAEMVAVCADHDLGGINRGPLAMGLLSGKYQSGRALGGDDVRGKAPEWLSYFRDGVAAPEWAAKVDAVREALTSGGRTLSQGALGWLLRRSPHMIPIPGIRTVAQAAENAAALAFGPLGDDEYAQVEAQLR